jgi:hypothetical protein
MRYIVTTLLSAGAIGTLACATPALAQTVGAAPAPAAGYDSYGHPYGLTRASHTGAPSYSWHNQGPWYAPGGECRIIAGNHVCFSDSSAFVGQ